MKAERIIKLSFVNLWRRKLRTMLTIWGMSVGIGAMVMLISFAAGLQEEVRKSFLSSTTLTEIRASKQDPNKVISSGSQEIEGFTNDDIEKLQKLEHVKLAYLSIYLPMLKLTYKENAIDITAEPFPIERISDQQRTSLVVGSFWNSNQDAAIVLSSVTAAKLKIETKDLVNQDVSLNFITFTPAGPQPSQQEYKVKVTGILKKDSGAFVSGQFGQELLAYELAKKIFDDQSKVEGGINLFRSSQALVIVDDSKNVTSVRRAIENLGFYPASVEDILKSMDQGFLIMKIVLGIVGGIALFVALIGITNSMLMAVLERTREIGILKALGASRKTISALFLTESAWLGVFGALLGIGGAYLIGKGIVAGFKTFVLSRQSDPSVFPPITFTIGWELFFGTLLGAILVTLLAGWLPARRAATQDPVHALRHE